MRCSSETSMKCSRNTTTEKSASFVDAIEKWLSEAEEGQAGTKASGGESTGNRGRGGTGV
jgi:hypothetical protein